MADALAIWNAAKSKYKDLSNTKKYKTDLAPLITQYRALAEQVGKFYAQTEKLQTEKAEAVKKAAAAHEAKLEALSQAKSKIADATRLVMEDIRKVFASSGDWTTPIGPKAAKYDALIGKYQQNDQQVDQAVKGHEAAKKATDKSFGDRIAISEANDKKLSDARIKLSKQVSDLAKSYRDTAKSDGNDDIAKEMQRVMDAMSGLP